MEHIHDCLVMIFKNVHLPFIAAGYLKVYARQEGVSTECTAPGDNFPRISVNDKSPVSHGKCRL